MTTTNTYSRQPTKLDYASPTQFKFNVIKLPKVTYFCTQVNVPGITLGGTIDQVTRFKDIPQPGDKLTYGELNMTFLVDENLENYQEIHGWLVGLGFPRDHSEFRNLLVLVQTGFLSQMKRCQQSQVRLSLAQLTKGQLFQTPH